MFTLLVSGLRAILVALFAAPALAAENLALRRQLPAFRRQISSLSPIKAMETLLSGFAKFPTNQAFLDSINT